MLCDDGKSAIEGFIKQLNPANPAILLLDYDGTLAPFQVDRRAAYPYPGIIPILDRITRSGRTRVVVISGRPTRELQIFLDPLKEIEIWGAHGLEHLHADGTYQSTTISSDVLAILAEAEEWIRESGLLQLAEVKPGGIAVHWRGLPIPEIERVKGRTHEGWDIFASNLKLKLLDFDGGIELRIARPNKGDVVSTILKEAGSALEEAGSALVAFLGDDFTDEDAFRVLGKRGLSVLVRSEYRETKADAWVRPPQGLILFLQQWSEALTA